MDAISKVPKAECRVISLRVGVRANCRTEFSAPDVGKRRLCRQARPKTGCRLGVGETRKRERRGISPLWVGWTHVIRLMVRTIAHASLIEGKKDSVHTRIFQKRSGAIQGCGTVYQQYVQERKYPTWKVQQASKVHRYKVCGGRKREIG